MSLIDVCYEQIKDNFWYGLFGDFKLIIDKKTGYFNATKLCAIGGRRFDHWMENKYSKELQEYYQDLASRNPGGLNPSYKIMPCGTNPVDLLISGTYLREELILNLACWISHDFYDKCYKIIKDYFLQDFSKLKSDNQKFQERLNEVEEKMADLEKTVDKLELISSPYTRQPEMRNVFAVVRTDNEEYPYRAVRTQIRSFKKSVAGAEIVYKRIDPNALKLYSLMKENLDITCSGVTFGTDISEEDLLKSIDNLYEEILNYRD